MTGDMIHPRNTVFSGPTVYQIVFETSPIVRLSSLWSTMSPQDLLLKAQVVFWAIG